MIRVTYLRGVATLSLDEEKCTGCGICLDVCPHSVFQINGSKAIIVDLDACMECGACALNCPFDALSVSSGVGCAKALISRRAVKKETLCSQPQGSSPGAGANCCSEE